MKNGDTSLANCSDSAGQTLTVLGMNVAQLVQKKGRMAPELAAEAETVQETVQQLHRDVRTTSYLLHPPLLDESGLYSALSWYTQGLLERSGLQINLDMSQEFGRLPRDMELVVFRLVQECLTNIHRHSGSKTASIRIAREESQIVVDIGDAGNGMSVEGLSEIQSGGSGGRHSGNAGETAAIQGRDENRIQQCRNPHFRIDSTRNENGRGRRIHGRVSRDCDLGCQQQVPSLGLTA